MSKILKQKSTMLNEINELVSNSVSTTVINYSKTTSLEIKLLRKELFNNNLKIKVLKNTLTKKALVNTTKKDLIPYITGQILIIFGQDEVFNHINLVNNFNKKNNNLKIKAIYIYNKLFINDDIKKIINLNSKETEIYNIITSIKTPLTLLINILKVLTQTKIGEQNVNK